MKRWLYVSLTLYLRTALNTSELTVPILPIYSHFISMFIAGINFQLDRRVFGVVKNNDDIKLLLECGPMPNLMVALPNIYVAPSDQRRSLADAHY